MRLTLVINSLNSGGAERGLSIVASELAQRGHDVTVVTFDPEQSDPEYALVPQVKVERLGIGLGGTRGLDRVRRLAKFIPALKRGLLAQRPECVISYMDQANIATIIALRGMGIRVLVCEQVFPKYSSLVGGKNLLLAKVFNTLRNIVYRHAAHIVVLSDVAIEYFPAFLRSKCSVIPNPVALPRAEHYEGELKKPFVVALGRLVPQKRFDLLISAFAYLAREFPEWNLYIFGRGHQRKELKRMVAEFDLGEQIVLAGRTKSPYGVLKRADIFVLASDFEGFPLVLCEAMACGLPVISTDCPTGPADLIDHGTNGLLVPRDDRAAMTEALRKLMKDPELRKRLAENAPKVLERYGAATIVGKWERLILGVSE